MLFLSESYHCLHCITIFWFHQEEIAFLEDFKKCFMILGGLC